IGRSAIRNQLAAEAQGEFLWFLDCDADASVNAELAKNFIDRMQKGELLSGGRIYQKQPPADATKYLHWLWCSERELIDPVKRMSDPVNNFLSNNFVVHSEDFRQVQFDTTFSGYGYEDTFFAYELLSKGVNIVHIHNPVEHTGLESKDQFLLKIGQSLNNLILLRQICMQRGIAFPVKSKLVYWYQWFRRPMIYPFAWVFTLLLLPICQWQLRQKRPSLFILDLYRLTMLMKIS
ncbi:MAG: hypothetical protein IT240_01785, partial [Bacteroidia bacterium]|nr:hypothetical protein [Bacteroidia bacterium]